MANELKINNGFISSNTSSISGGLLISGSVAIGYQSLPTSEILSINGSISSKADDYSTGGYKALVRNESNGKYEVIDGLIPSSGIYFPYIGPVTNVSSVSRLGSFTYTRIGDIVTVAGNLSLSTTLTGSKIRFNIELPVTSVFVSASDCNGVMTHDEPDNPGLIAGVISSSVGFARIEWFSSRTMFVNPSVMFQYQILSP